jgi:hypothetical protein
MHERTHTHAHARTHTHTHARTHTHTHTQRRRRQRRTRRALCHEPWAGGRTRTVEHRRESVQAKVMCARRAIPQPHKNGVSVCTRMVPTANHGTEVTRARTASSPRHSQHRTNTALKVPSACVTHTTATSKLQQPYTTTTSRKNVQAQ